MIDNPITHASAFLTATPDEHSPARVFASALLEEHLEVTRLRLDNRRLVHERDRAVERAESAAMRRQEKIWPLVVRCDTPRCESVVAFDPAPEEAVLASVLLAAGWSTLRGHHCPKCKAVP